MRRYYNNATQLSENVLFFGLVQDFQPGDDELKVTLFLMHLILKRNHNKNR